MDETDFEKQFKSSKVPAASHHAKDKTKQAAWEALQKKPSRSTRHSNFAKAASVVLVTGTLLGLLSYSVTSSTRSSGGDAGKETNKISSSQLSQYPASIRTSIVRMLLRDIPMQKLEFYAPAEFEKCSDNSNYCVFHPQGGGATYVKAPGILMANGQEKAWVYNIELNLKEVGSEDPDLVAYLSGVSQGICESINKELGLGKPLPLTEDQSALYNTNWITEKVDTSEPNTLATNPEISGQPFGCFLSHDQKEYVYYHVLIER